MMPIREVNKWRMLALSARWLLGWYYCSQNVCSILTSACFGDQEYTELLYLGTIYLGLKVMQYV